MTVQRILADLRPWTVARLVLLASAAIIGGALYIEHVLGYPACKLCYQQRIPYYVAMAVSAALSFPSVARRAPYGIVVLGLAFAVGVALAGHHVGVEAGWLVGPTDCSGSPTAIAPNVADFMSQLSRTRVANCAAPALKVFGLSLSAWNLAASIALVAGIAGWGLARRGERSVQGRVEGAR